MKFEKILKKSLVVRISRKGKLKIVGMCSDLEQATGIAESTAKRNFGSSPILVFQCVKAIGRPTPEVAELELVEEEIHENPFEAIFGSGFPGVGGNDVGTDNGDYDGDEDDDDEDEDLGDEDGDDDGDDEDLEGDEGNDEAEMEAFRNPKTLARQPIPVPAGVKTFDEGDDDL